MPSGEYIEVIPVKTDMIRPGIDVIGFILKAVDGLIRRGDVIVISSKALITGLKEFIDLSRVEPSGIDYRYSGEYGVDPKLIRVIRDYSNRFYGGSSGFILTEIDGVILPNAGIDRKNVPGGLASKPPTILRDTGLKIYDALIGRYGRELGLVISDSNIYPLRTGTRGFALFVYGFNPIRSYVGSRDLHGRPIKYTIMNIADEVASAAHLAMGEGGESIPIVIVRGLRLEFMYGDQTRHLIIGRNICLYNRLYRD